MDRKNDELWDPGRASTPVMMIADWRRLRGSTAKIFRG